VRDFDLDHVFLFWTRPEKWPKVAGYVFLAKAALALGQAMFRTWTDLDPVIEPLNPSLLGRSDQAARAITAEWWHRREALEEMMGPERTAVALTAAARAESRSHFIEVQQKIAELAVTGVLKTSMRPVPGGELTEVPAHWWRTENEYLAARFARCRLYPGQPFSKTMEINDRYDFYIFVSEQSLKTALARISSAPEGTEGGAAIYKTGLAGHPTSIDNLIMPEARRRIANGQFPATQREFAKLLSEWLKATHESAPPATAKAIENNRAFRALWRSRTSSVPK
jgi:hypothetical protein